MKENFPETFKSQLEKNKNVIHRPGSVRIGRNSALGRSEYRRGRRPRAVLTSSGIVSPNTVRPRPVNNKYVSLVYKDVKPKKYKFFTVFCLRKTGIVILDNKRVANES